MPKDGCCGLTLVTYLATIQFQYPCLPSTITPLQLLTASPLQHIQSHLYTTYSTMSAPVEYQIAQAPISAHSFNADRSRMSLQ